MRSGHSALRALGSVLALSLLLGACATLREDLPPPRPSQALAPDPEAPLGMASAERLRGVASGSAFRLLESGQSALAARLALVEQARHSLDLQYYIFRFDVSGRLLVDALIRAAQRGVRVRILLDDLDSHDNEDVIAGLDAHKLIEVRLFNPFKVRGQAPLGRLAEWLAGDGRVNRRMHNKLMVADNHFGITGGRNIGDEYFQADASVAFRDLDVLATGEVVPRLSEAFDRYWNAPQVVSARALPTIESRRQLRAVLDREVADLRVQLARVLDELRAIEPVGGAVAAGCGPWTAGRAEVLIDDPAKTLDGVESADLPVRALLRLGSQVRRELLIASPYFVPGKRGVAWLRERHDGGRVRVRILTNSLAATDVPLVHAGYAPYRRALLEAGIELYELKPLKERTRWGLALTRGSSRASLHGKAVVFDRSAAYVGSMNLDPRSIHLNTESGLILHGSEIAGQVADYVEAAMRPERSYVLGLVPDRREREDWQAAYPDLLAWTERTAKGDIVHSIEPRASAPMRAYIELLSWLPIEENL